MLLLCWRDLLSYDGATFDDLTKGLRSELSVLESHLKSRTWLVGQGMTLADVVTAATVKYFFESLLNCMIICAEDIKENSG